MNYGDPFIGRTLKGGDLELQGALGAGGMGRVYRGWSKRSNEPVAVKVIGLAAASHSGLARLRREVEATQRISHPNVVRIEELGVEQSDQLVFVVMELIEGLDVWKLVKSRGPLPFPRACRIARDVCLALDAAHSVGVLHRDVKPSNIMLTRSFSDRGATDLVKLVDFGLARIDGSDVTQLTETGTTMGTPGFMPIEQLMGEKLDVRADVFGVGASLYALLTGTPPYRAKELGALLRLMSALPARITTIPRGLDELLRHSLAPESRDRLATTRQFAEALEPFCADSATEDFAVEPREPEAKPEAKPEAEPEPVLELDLPPQPAASESPPTVDLRSPREPINLEPARPLLPVIEVASVEVEAPAWRRWAILGVVVLVFIGGLRLGGRLQGGSLPARITNELTRGNHREATAIYFRDYRDARRNPSVEVLLPGLFARWAESRPQLIDPGFTLTPCTFSGAMHERTFELHIDRVEGTAFTGRIVWTSVATLNGYRTNPVVGLHFNNQVLFVDTPTTDERDLLHVLNGVKEAVIVAVNGRRESRVALVGTASPYQFPMLAFRSGSGPVPERSIEQLTEFDRLDELGR